MITYADSSVLVAWFHPDDEFARPVTDWMRDHMTDLLWNPILRLEVRHNLRRLRSTYARPAWNAPRAAEKSRLRFGRGQVRDLLDDADDLSGEVRRHDSGWDLGFLPRRGGDRPARRSVCD